MNYPATGRRLVTRPRILLGTLALLAGSVGVSIVAEAAGTTAVNSNADAWVDAGNPTVNHGSTTWLQIDNSPDLHAYMMFNVAVPAGEHVTSAQLTVRANQTNSGGFEVHTSTADWVESAITYANAPAVGSTVYGVSGAVTTGVDASVDVTSAIPAAGGAVSLVLVNRTGASYSVKAREAGASTAPRLTVTTAANTPVTPTASFTASPTSGDAPLTVQFTDTSTGSPSGWTWDFGDGTTSTQQNPSHVFQNPGAYTVTLTASNGGGSSTASTTITANAPPPPPSPPVASFTSDKVAGTAPLSVAFTDTSTGGPTSWAWDFGDGGTSTLQNPSHVFQAGGVFTVTLTASNAGGFSTASTTITVAPQVAPDPPTASFTANPTSGTAPLTVQFTDTSTGGPTSWSWDFGDGTTSTQQNPSHVFQNAGAYTVTLTASNLGGSSTASTTITANVPPPVAGFTVNPTSGTAPLTVQFTDTSTGGPTSWSWDFGDGTTSTQQNPSHVFQNAGAYTVTLTATNVGGSTTKSTTVTANPPAPVAGFTANPTSGNAPLTVQFTDTSTGGPTSWSWDFGDGSTSTEQNPSHVFRNPNTYTVTLTATNSGGSTTKSTTITANTPPPARPVASFTSSATSGPAPLTVQFTDTSTNVPTAWSWTFGDGGTSTQQNPSYVYRTAGTYTASLTATNAAGSSTATKTITISAGSTNLGFRDQSYPNGPAAVTGEKPESKLWFNAGVWWADMFDSASGTFHIFRLNRTTEQWVDTGTQLDNRVSTKADTLWDGTHLYVASHVIASSSSGAASGNPSRLYRFSFNAATQTYTLDSGFPVNINNVSSETLVIAEDSLGAIWATWAQASKIEAARSDPGGTNWGTPFAIPTSGAAGLSSDDISSIVTVGSAQIGVMWSNQSSGTLYFGVHSDSDKPNQRWTFKVLQSGAHAADDHINLKQLDRDTSGRIYAVVKTSFNDISPQDPNAPLINVWVRDTSGNWTSYVFGRVGDNHTRPILLLDSTNQMIYVFATGPSTYGNGAFEGSIYMKRTPMNAISFTPGLGTPVIRDAKSSSMNNVTSTKQTVTSASGLVVLASNDSTRQYWHADIALAP